MIGEEATRLGERRTVVPGKAMLGKAADVKLGFEGEVVGKAGIANVGDPPMTEVPRGEGRAKEVDEMTGDGTVATPVNDGSTTGGETNVAKPVADRRERTDATASGGIPTRSEADTATEMEALTLALIDGTGNAVGPGPTVGITKIGDDCPMSGRVRLDTVGSARSGMEADTATEIEALILALTDSCGNVGSPGLIVGATRIGDDCPISGEVKSGKVGGKASDMATDGIWVLRAADDSIAEASPSKAYPDEMSEVAGVLGSIGNDSRDMTVKTGGETVGSSGIETDGVVVAKGKESADRRELSAVSRAESRDGAVGIGWLLVGRTSGLGVVKEAELSAASEVISGPVGNADERLASKSPAPDDKVKGPAG